MTGFSGAAKRLIRNLSNMWSAENNFRAGSSDGVGHLIGAGSHPGHCTDSHEPDVVRANKVGDFILCHRLCISVDEKDFMFRWRETFE